MKPLIPALLLASLPALAQSGDCSKAFEASQNPGAQITMTLRAGNIDVVGTSANVIRVTCQITPSGEASKTKITYAAGRLQVYGGSDKNVRYKVEVPAKSGIIIRASAGDMNVSGITGDKDIELKAGNLTVAVGDPASYKVAEAKLMAGNLNAKPFGVQKDGIAPSFRRDNNAGQYRFRAELMAGDLTLK